MKFPLLILLISTCYLQACAQDTMSSYQELELTYISQLKSDGKFNLEPSGIVVVDGKTYINSDENSDIYLYQINFEKDYWYINDSITLNLDNKLDLEAIDYYNGTYYLANESTGNILKRKPNGQIEKIDIDFGDETPGKWKNAGWEGLAYDPKQNILYLAKERQPRKVIVVSLNSLTVIDTFNIPQTESNDFADAKFVDGYLYLLERNGNHIAKVDPKTNTVVDKVSYRQTCSNEKGKLFAPYKYGMAEALYLNENEIWLGLDNNIIEASEFGKEKFNLKGNAPVFLKFKRPKGF